MALRILKLCFALAALQAGQAFALACDSNASGNWNAAATWTNCGGGFPGALDTANIRLGHIVSITNTPNTVAGITVTNGTLRFNGGAKTLNLNGSVTIAAAGIFTVNPASNNTHTLNITGDITNNGTLTFGTGNDRCNVNFTSGATQSIGGGGATTQFNNVTATGGTTVNITSGGAKTFVGNVLITGTLNNPANAPVSVGGNFTNNGTFSSGTGTYTFQTTAGATWAGTSGLAFSGNVVVNATRTNNTTTNITGNLTGTSTLTNAAAQTLRIGGNANGLTGLTATAAGNTVDYNGAGAQTAKITNYVNLTVSSGGAVAFGGSFSIAGNLTDNGNFSHTGAANIVTFNGAAAQSLLGAAINTTFQNATMAITAAAATRSLTIGHDMTVTNVLTFTAGGGSGGRIVTGASKVVIQAAGAGAILNACPTDTNDFVAGNLQRFVAAGASTVAFPIGIDAAAGCRRVSLTFTGVGAGGGSLIVFTTTGDHPQIGTSGLDAANSLNRYYTLTTTGVTGTALPAFTSYDATFNWVAADRDGTSNPLAYIAARYAGGVWNPTGEGAVTATSLTVTGETDPALGEFAIGEVLGYNAALGRFNAYDVPPTTPAGSVHGNIRTKLSGAAFTLTVVHLNVAGTALAPFGAAQNVTVDLMNAADNTGAFANNCGPNWVVIQSVVINFAAGTSAQTVNFTENNSWKEVRIRATLGAQRGCSGDRFAIRPQSLTTAATDATWSTPGTARTLNATAFNGAPVHKAGQPFTIQVTTPGVANYVTAGSHTGTPTFRSLACTFPTGGAPACTGCANGTLTLGAFAAGAGALTSNTASYTEAGTFNLDLHDTAYAQVDAADTPATYSNVAPIGRFVPQAPAAAAVGRFVPDNFLVATNNVPQFQTFGSTCAARSFTYVGQPFGYVAAAEPQALVTAREAGGATATNYRECVWKITTAAPSDVTQAYNNVTGPAIDASLANNAPTISPGNGTGTVTVNALDRIAYTRSLTTPIGPFNANITLGVSVRDDSEADGQITGNTATFDGGGTGIGFDSGIEFRYGRVRMLNALGSEKLNLPVPIRTEHWAGTGFITNAADNCTGFVAANFALGNYQGGITAVNMDASHVSVGGAFSSGAGSLTLTAPTPTPATPGSVDICLDLDVGAGGDTTCQAATPADKTWLQTRNAPPNYDDDPKARAAFGVYGTQPQNFIYFRENY